MVMLNFEKIKNQVKDSVKAFSSGIDIMEITSLVMILVILCNICGLLFWTTGQNWINWGIGIFILIGFWFTFKKIKTMKQPPLLVVESKEGKECNLLLSNSRPETDDFASSFGDILSSQDPQWINQAISTVWRHIRKPSQKFVLRKLAPSVQNVLKSKTSFVRLELFKFDLGSIPPKVKRIEFHELDIDGDKMFIDIDLIWHSEASVHIKLFTELGLCPLRAEINEILIKIKLRMVVNGIMKDPPYLKSFDVNFREFPVLKWKAGGVASMIKDASILYNMIMKQLDKYMRPMVFPRKLSLPLNCFSMAMPKSLVKIISRLNSQSYYETVLPRPYGILNVQIKRGRNLIEADRVSSLTNPRSFFKSPTTWMKNVVPRAQTSDPFVQIKIGSSCVESKVCFNTLDPEFNLACDIPLECPSNNILYIKLFDYDRLKSNEPLGVREEDLSQLYQSSEDPAERSSGQSSNPDDSTVGLSWKGLARVEHGEILMGCKWQPVKVHQEDDDNCEGLRGVISFAIQELCLEAPGKPRVEVKLVKYKDDEDKLRMTNLDSWVSMKPGKKSLRFELGDLVEKTMDPFLLNGGMLSFDSSDKEIEINIETKSKRPFMYSTEKWSKTVTIEQVIEMSHSYESPNFELEKQSSTSQDFFKATGKSFRTLVRRLTTHNREEESYVNNQTPREQMDNTKTGIKMKFIVYVV